MPGTIKLTDWLYQICCEWRTTDYTNMVMSKPIWTHTSTRPSLPTPPNYPSTTNRLPRTCNRMCNRHHDSITHLLFKLRIGSQILLTLHFDEHMFHDGANDTPTWCALRILTKLFCTSCPVFRDEIQCWSVLLVRLTVSTGRRWLVMHVYWNHHARSLKHV